MKKLTALGLCALFCTGLLAGCSAAPASSASSSAPSSAPASSAASEAQVAGSSEMVTPQEVVEPGMVPVYGDSLNDGVYPVTVDSSSSMFNIEACTLTVENGSMSAVMTMGGTGYLHIFMGTGEQAAAADSAQYIPFNELTSGEHTFTVPVEALDTGIDCAAFSKKKEKWYDRVILFRADSLPVEAFRAGSYATVESLGLADGLYTVEVQLMGGTGKATVESPARLQVEKGAATATLRWSSSNYDYMKVDGVQYDALSMEGGSLFAIPVLGFDFKMPVIADTVAMSTPHEIEYSLYFDSATLEAVQ